MGAKFPKENLVCVWEEKKGLHMGVRLSDAV